MEDFVKINIQTERQVVRNDEISELDMIIEITSGTEDKVKVKQNLNLCIVIDKSGSMHGEKLETAKKSCIEIFKRLTEDDLFTVVVYDDEAQVIINPLTDKKDIVIKIQSIESGGQTNLSLGWYLGLLELQTYLGENRINKLLLISDGQANAGETKKSVLGSLAQKMREEFGITNSTIGIGDDFNEDLLDIISTESGGRFWFIKEANIENIIETEFKGALDILVENPKIEIVLTKGVTISRELNNLRKISDRYSLSPITSNYDNCFAIRLEINPHNIEQEDISIKAILYNRNIKLQESIKSLKLKPVDEYVLSPLNSTVSAMIIKFEKSRTEEKMIEKLDSGDFDFMKTMIIKEVDGMKKVIDSMEDERKKKEMLLELSDIENTGLITKILIKLDSVNFSKYKDEIEHVINHSRKSLKYQSHRNSNAHMRHSYDDLFQINILEDILLLIESIIEDYPDDIELLTIKKEINDKLGSN
jgi:Ca-activated chloride channel homolog